MKRFFSGLLFGLVFGSIAGVAAGIFIFPYLFPPPLVNETVTNVDSRKVLATGQFIHANPDDPVHYGSGKVTVYSDLLHLEADFKVGPGPKYHVYLVSETEVGTKTAVHNTMFVDLGRLKSFQGSQNYSIPQGVEIKDYPHVVIWCEQFNVLISPAKLAL
ncbi:MAG: hypothetical protein ACI8P9_002549 [Parasphingorhabdus sp.]|jgi:uncharacterized protein involved in high-affinity Fe2+ transport